MLSAPSPRVVTVVASRDAVVDCMSAGPLDVGMLVKTNSGWDVPICSFEEDKDFCSETSKEVITSTSLGGIVVVFSLFESFSAVLVVGTF